jgi:hypothetical protein
VINGRVKEEIAERMQNAGKLNQLVWDIFRK